jgi:putative transcriptional regulator
LTFDHYRLNLQAIDTFSRQNVACSRCIQYHFLENLFRLSVTKTNGVLKMVDNQIASLKGHILVAMPGLTDPSFTRTVSCICEHTHEGAVGIVINRVQTALTGKNIFDELDIEHTPATESLPIHIGGPVHIDEIFVLHGPPFDWEACLMITPNLGMSNTRDIIEAIALGKGPEAFLVSLGCAGWAAGQLEHEIRQNAWLTDPLDESLVFSTPVESRWEAALKNMGIDPALLSDTAGHA